MSTLPPSRSSSLRLLYVVAARDMTILLRTPWIAFSRALYFLIQLFVFAAFVNQVVDIPFGRAIGLPGVTYYDFYAVGSVLVTLASTAFLTGHHVYEEAELGLLDYLLSLPVPRRLYILARSIGGALRSLVYVTPMFLLVAFLQGFQRLDTLVAAYVTLLLLAIGITGLSITVAVSIRNESRFDLAIAFLELLLIRFSTALYPRVFMPTYAGVVAPYTPVTSAAEILRGVLFQAVLNPLDLLALLGFVTVFFALGATFYFRRIEGGYFA